MKFIRAELAGVPRASTEKSLCKTQYVVEVLAGFRGTGVLGSHRSFWAGVYTRKTTCCTRTLSIAARVLGELTEVMIARYH